MNELATVSLDEILSLHDEWLQQLGGSPGVWNRDVLMYAHDAQTSQYYEGVFEKAANFGGRITKEHAFNDGNKRTGLLVLASVPCKEWLFASSII